MVGLRPGLGSPSSPWALHRLCAQPIKVQGTCSFVYSWGCGGGAPTSPCRPPIPAPRSGGACRSYYANPRWDTLAEASEARRRAAEAGAGPGSVASTSGRQPGGGAAASRAALGSGDDDCAELARYPGYFARNRWPTRHLPSLEPSFKGLGGLMCDVGELIMQQCDRCVAVVLAPWVVGTGACCTLHGQKHQPGSCLGGTSPSRVEPHTPQSRILGRSQRAACCWLQLSELPTPTAAGTWPAASARSGAGWRRCCGAAATPRRACCTTLRPQHRPPVSNSSNSMERPRSRRRSTSRRGAAGTMTMGH